MVTVSISFGRIPNCIHLELDIAASPASLKAHLLVKEHLAFHPFYPFHRCPLYKNRNDSWTISCLLSATTRHAAFQIEFTSGHNISTEEVYLSTFVFGILFSPIPVESRNHRSFPSSGRRSRISSLTIFHPSFYIALLIRGTERFSIKSFRRCNVMLQLPSFGQANSHCLSMTILAKRKELRALNT